MTGSDGRSLVRRLLNRVPAARSTPPRTGPATTVDDLQGTPREPEPEVTHVGPLMDQAVHRTRRRMRPAGVDPDYDLAHEHFDVRHFLLQARHLIESDKADPLAIFLRNGAEARASPEINFDMPAYLSRHPEHAGGPEQSPYLEWLKRGRERGELADPAPGLEAMARVLGREPTELAGHLAELRTDVQQRLLTGTLGEMFARAAEVEPLVADAWGATTRPTIPPFYSDATVSQVAAIHACQAAAGSARAKLVLVISDARWGGGRRAEGHIAHALSAHHAPDDIVVVYTDESRTAPAGRFPVGVREIDFASATEGMEREHAHRALVELVRSFRSDAVVAINSRLFYEALATYGKALASSERLFMVVFCNEQLAMGNWVGIPLRFFYRCYDLMEAVITDSDHLADWLRERHLLSGASDRIHVLRAPVDPDLPVASPPGIVAGRRPQVFWAGRWDRQKRVGLAVEVARRMPDVDVRMWGEAVLTPGHQREVADNVRLEGRYDHITDLDLSEADVWLYTSAWDGVPSQLLEVAMTGLPIVGSLVGGTGEVLDDAHSWPVAEVDDPEAYVRAIRDVLADPDRARARATALRERLLEERNEAAFGRSVASLLLPEDGVAAP